MQIMSNHYGLIYHDVIYYDVIYYDVIYYDVIYYDVIIRILTVFNFQKLSLILSHPVFMPALNNLLYTI